MQGKTRSLRPALYLFFEAFLGTGVCLMMLQLLLLLGEIEIMVISSSEEEDEKPCEVGTEALIFFPATPVFLASLAVPGMP